MSRRRSTERPWRKFWKGDVVMRLMWKRRGFEVTTVAADATEDRSVGGVVDVFLMAFRTLMR